MAFDRVGVVVSDIYFLDPDPIPGQESAERGVRLELRRFERNALNGSIYSAVPIAIGQPIWRVDLLESVDSPGTLDRAHHHPRFREWEPGPRVFLPELSADPVRWVRDQFAHIETVLEIAGCGSDSSGTTDTESLRAAGPMVADMVEHLLAEIAAGRAALEPRQMGDAARESWL
jgi:hypothetical protein